MVLSEGPPHARIALVGESPGDEEVKQGRPFVGPSGKVLNLMLEEAGIKREECYITNLLPTQPNPSGASPSLRNDFGVLYQDSKRNFPTQLLLDSVTELKTQLAEVKPNLIIALGAEPLRWLGGVRGIEDWRGSVVEGEVGKVIGTHHPAAITRDWALRPISVFDLKKGLQESTYPEVERIPRVHRVIRSVTELENSLPSSVYTPVAFDIEVETNQVQSIALATCEDEAIVIPFWWHDQGSLWTPAEEEKLWLIIQHLLMTHPTYAHNAMYDLWYLSELFMDHQALCKALKMDTMVAFHILYPELPKGLEFLCSIYTDQPYYKHMRTTPDPDTFWRYNALDAMITWECAQVIEQELKGG